jgi:hypothetical protein
LAAYFTNSASLTADANIQRYFSSMKCKAHKLKWRMFTHPLLVLCMLFYYTNLLEISWCKMLYCGQATATMLLIMEKLASIKSIKNL